MTTIKASCPICGDHRTALEADHRHRIPPQPAPVVLHVHVRPICHDLVRKPADEDVLKVLRGYVPWQRVPLEVEEDHDGPVLTDIDLSDFLLDLHTLDIAKEAGQ